MWCNYAPMPCIQQRLNQISVQVKAWLSSLHPTRIWHAITYACHNKKNCISKRDPRCQAPLTKVDAPQWQQILYAVRHYPKHRTLTHWGRVTHKCGGKLTIIGSDNGLSPDRRQAIIWTNDGILLIGPLGTNFSEILIEILTFSFKKMRLKVSSAKRRPFCFGLNVLMIT